MSQADPLPDDLPPSAVPDPFEAQIPRDSLLLGFGAVLPLPAAGLLAWFLPMPWPMVLGWLAIWWGAVVLLFMAGVRRGLSFGRAQGARGVDFVSMFWLFLLGAGALVAPRPLLSLVLLSIGYASVAILDPAAARVGIAPAHFARLRPMQAALALVGLLALILYRTAMTMPL